MPGASASEQTVLYITLSHMPMMFSEDTRKWRWEGKTALCDGMIGKPAQEHEKKKILGFAVRKDEPSGRAFWSMVRKAFPDRNDFFSFASVQNFCPLAFLKNESGANITPDRLMKEDREALEALCLDYLGYLLDALDVKTVVAIGNYVEKMVKKLDFPHIVKIMHPSPVNPKAHEVWSDDGVHVIEYLKKERVF